MDKNKNVIQEAVANPSDPRVFPRAAVLAGAAGFFGWMTYNGFQSKVVGQMDEKNSEIRLKTPRNTSSATKAMADALPNVMQTRDQLESAGHEGLLST